MAQAYSVDVSNMPVWYKPQNMSHHFNIFFTKN